MPLILGIWVFGIAQKSRAAELVASTKAPTGSYVSFCPGTPTIRMEEHFVVDLKTNGAYSVLVTGSRTNREIGVWTWNAAKKQFLLTASKHKIPQFRVLRVDPEQADTLKWVIDEHDAGTVEYFKFKRQFK